MSVLRPVVQNVVSCGKLDIESDLNLKHLAEKIQNSRYNKKRFPALIVRKTKPKCTFMIFQSGRMIILGSESEKDAHLGAKKVAKDISKALSIRCKLAEFRITNLVANSDIGFQINLGKLAEERNAFKDDSFPGVVYRNLKSIKSALIFHTGKVLFTGVTNRDAMELAFDDLTKKLLTYKKPTGVPKLKSETQISEFR